VKNFIFPIGTRFAYGKHTYTITDHFFLGEECCVKYECVDVLSRTVHWDTVGSAFLAELVCNDGWRSLVPTHCLPPLPAFVARPLAISPDIDLLRLVN
jgi:hypothetical protein